MNVVSIMFFNFDFLLFTSEALLVNIVFFQFAVQGAFADAEPLRKQLRAFERRAIRHALADGNRRPLSSVNVRFGPSPRKLSVPVPERVKNGEVFGVWLA